MHVDNEQVKGIHYFPSVAVHDHIDRSHLSNAYPNIDAMSLPVITLFHQQMVLLLSGQNTLLLLPE